LEHSLMIMLNDWCRMWLLFERRCSRHE
jgi:hypothetical protein